MHTPPPHTHTHFLCHSTKISINITQRKNLNFKNPTGNATFFKIFHRESSGIEISKRNSHWKLIILHNLPRSSAGIFLSNVTGSNWNHTRYQNLPQCSAGTCIKFTNIFRLDLTSNPAGIGIPLSFFHRGGGVWISNGITQYHFLTKLPQIAHIHRNHNFSIGIF